MTHHIFNCLLLHCDDDVMEHPGTCSHLLYRSYKLPLPRVSLSFEVVFVLFFLDGWVVQYSEEAKIPVQAFCCVTVPRPRPGCLLIIGMQGKWKRAWFEFDSLPSFYHNAFNNVIYIIKGVSMEILGSGWCFFSR